MLHENLKSNKTAALAAWRTYFALAILQTCLALALILQTRSADSAGSLLGLSSIRLALAIGLGAFLLIFSWLLLETWIRPVAFERHWERLVAALSRKQVWNGLLALFGAFTLLGLFSIAQLSQVDEPFTRLIFDRLSPLLIWITGLSGQTLVALLVLRHGRETLSLRPQGRLFYLVLLAFAVIFLGWSWVASTVMPVESQRLGWNLLGVPIVEWQVLLAWLAGVLMLLSLAWLDRPSPRPSWLKRFALRRFDLLWILLIWLAAVIAWQSVPLQPSWFLTQPVPPNQEFYPSSDAQTYDVMAQTALVGEGYRYYGLLYTRRPLLAMYLTVLHLLGGQDYQLVVFFQILIFAWLPVLIYLLTKALHNRISAVIAAALIIIREANSIWLTERITTSHVKLLMADLPAMFVTVLFVLLSVLWLQNMTHRKLLALMCGGALGVAMLVRPETAVYAFPLLLISALLLFPGRRWRLWLQSSLLFALGLLLVISPWIWRNYSVTGEIFFDNPLHNSSLIAQRFRSALETPAPSKKKAENPLSITPAPSSTQAHPSIQTPAPRATQPTPTVPAPSTSNQRLLGQINRSVGLALQNPGAVVQATFAHSLNSQVQSLLILPVVFRIPEDALAWLGHRSEATFWEDCCGLVSYVRRTPFWRQWDGSIPASLLVALLLNLLLVAYGVNEAWKRTRWAGLAVLAFSLTYMLANAVFHNSGGRYILPVDWPVLVYFSIGLAQFTQVLIAYLRGAPVVEQIPADLEPARVSSAPLLHSPYFYAALLALFLLGCAVPALEASFSPRYEQARRDAMLSTLLRSPLLSTAQRDDLKAFLSRGGVAYAGRALYPRYFEPGAGNPGVGKANPLSPKPYPRIGFYLAGMQNNNLALPVDGQPSSFPNASDVLVVGCDLDNLILVARYSAVGGLDEIYLRSFLPARLRCPLPPMPETDGGDD